MTFPFEITFKKVLLGEIERFSTTEILQFYKNDFIESGADFVEQNNDCITVKNHIISIFSIKPGFNWNRWIGVTSASLQILTFKDNKRIARYKVNLTKILVVGAIMGAFMGLIEHSVWLGFIVFFVLGILNWAIAISQHKIHFNEIIKQQHSLTA